MCVTRVFYLIFTDVFNGGLRLYSKAGRLRLQNTKKITSKFSTVKVKVLKRLFSTPKNEGVFFPIIPYQRHLSQNG